MPGRFTRGCQMISPGQFCRVLGAHDLIQHYGLSHRLYGQELQRQNFRSIVCFRSKSMAKKPTWLGNSGSFWICSLATRFR
jgi:hypothetical protein